MTVIQDLNKRQLVQFVKARGQRAFIRGPAGEPIISRMIVLNPDQMLVVLGESCVDADVLPSSDYLGPVQLGRTS